MCPPKYTYVFEGVPSLVWPDEYSARRPIFKKPDTEYIFGPIIVASFFPKDDDDTEYYLSKYILEELIEANRKILSGEEGVIGNFCIQRAYTSTINLLGVYVFDKRNGCMFLPNLNEQFEQDLFDGIQWCKNEIDAHFT